MSDPTKDIPRFDLEQVWHIWCQRSGCKNDDTSVLSDESWAARDFAMGGWAIIGERQMCPDCAGGCEQ